MKKILFLLFVLTATFITSACTKDVYTISIDKNDNITVTETMGIDKSDLSSLAGLFGFSESYKNIANLYKKCIKPEFEVISFEDNKFKGITQTKDSIPLKEFDNKYLITGLKSELKTPILISEGFIKNKYTMDFKYDRDIAQNYKFEPDKIPTDISKISRLPLKIQHNNDGTVSLTQGESSPIIIPEPDLKIRIQTPVKAKHHNATSVIDDKTYEWELYQDNPIVEIYLEYEKFNGTLGIIFLFISLVALFGFFGFIFVKSQNNISI